MEVNDDENLSCTECMKTFKGIRILSQHIKECHRVLTPKARPPKIQKVPFPYQCEYCDERFSLIKHLRSHERQEHKHFEALLDKISDSVAKKPSTSSGRLTKKERQYVDNLFHLESSDDDDDEASVEKWVTDQEKCKNPYVLLYKPLGRLSEKYPRLKVDDFVMVIMNKGQSVILEKHGSECICIDKILCTNNSHFDLITVLVLDEMRQGFPCAFLVTNRADQEILSLFLGIIKERVGDISPKVFISDMSEAFYKAWIQIMNIPQWRLYCTWQVEEEWNENLQTIKAKDKRNEVYRNLKMLMEETDITTFDLLVKAFVEKMSCDTDVAEFCNYFIDNYANCGQYWAYCYMLEIGLDTSINMHIERMHRSLKYLYLNGKRAKRLDTSFAAIMKFIGDKVLERLVVLSNQTIPSKLKELRDKHKRSLALATDIVIEDENGWLVPSFIKVPETYLVQKVRECPCQLVCMECNACIHQYLCTCLESNVKWNMCRHIHLVCRYRNTYQNAPAEIIISEADYEQNLNTYVNSLSSGGDSVALIVEVCENK